MMDFAENYSFVVQDATQGLQILFTIFRKMSKVTKNRRSSNSATYTEEQLRSVLYSIKSGQMSIRQASREFKIPRSTIQFRLSHKFNKVTHGPPPVLTSEEESIIVKWVLENFKGFPRRKDDIRSSVKDFLDKNPRATSYK